MLALRADCCSSHGGDWSTHPAWCGARNDRSRGKRSGDIMLPVERDEFEIRMSASRILDEVTRTAITRERARIKDLGANDIDGAEGLKRLEGAAQVMRQFVAGQISPRTAVAAITDAVVVASPRFRAVERTRPGYDFLAFS